MRSKSLCLLAGIGAFVAGISANSGQAHANLIQNPGFETGDFTDWTAVAVSYPIYVETEFVHSGTYAAQIAGYSYGPDTLSQTVADTPSQVYNLNFWLYVGDGYPTTSLDVTWNSTTVYSELNTGPFNTWYNISFDVTGTGSDALTFIDANDPSLTFLDDVSLTAATATPLPSTWTMLIAGFLALGFFAYRGTKKGSAAIAAA